MKMIVFLVLFLLVYVAINFYVGLNGWSWLKTTFSFKYKKTYIAFISISASSLFIGRGIDFLPITLLGYLWLIIIGYSLIILPVANLIVFLFRKKNSKKWVGYGVVSIFVFVLIYGSYNAWTPVVKEYNIKINKQVSEDNLKILMVSDLHSGNIVGEKHLKKLVKEVNKIKPDMVIIAGDIIDDNIEPFLHNNLGDTLKEMKAPLGVYAVMGNHDYYGDDKEALLKEMNRIGIKLLPDEYIKVNDELYIVGREDYKIKDRKALSYIIEGTDKNKPYILIDHQPTGYDEALENGMDLIVSGHTHRGQIAPGNLITNRIFENDYGYLQKENLHTIVSSGYGTWGPPLRIGSQSEIVIINVEFN